MISARLRLSVVCLTLGGAIWLAGGFSVEQYYRRQQDAWVWDFPATLAKETAARRLPLQRLAQARLNLMKDGAAPEAINRVVRSQEVAGSAYYAWERETEQPGYLQGILLHLEAERSAALAWVHGPAVVLFTTGLLLIGWDAWRRRGQRHGAVRP